MFNVTGNKSLAGGSIVNNINYPGNAAYITDVPQMGIQWQGQTGIGTNKDTFWTRGIPDFAIVGGELIADTAFAGWLGSYGRQLARGGWGFVGRDLSQALVAVNSYVPATRVLTLTGAVPGLVVGDYLRFHRVTDDFGRPVRGTFQVAAIAGAAITLVTGPPNPISTPNGNVRRDLLNFFQYSIINYLRAGVKKVGRPLLLYRGRRSKKR